MLALFARASTIVVEKVASLFMLAEISCKVSRIAGAVPTSDDIFAFTSSFVYESRPVTVTPFTSDDKLIPVPGTMFLIVDPDQID